MSNLSALQRSILEWPSNGTLKPAIARDRVRPRIVHHSDRGSQYASTEYVDLLTENNFLIRMSRTRLHTWI